MNMKLRNIPFFAAGHDGEGGRRSEAGNSLWLDYNRPAYIEAGEDYCQVCWRK